MAPPPPAVALLMSPFTGCDDNAEDEEEGTTSFAANPNPNPVRGTKAATGGPLSLPLLPLPLPPSTVLLSGGGVEGFAPPPPMPLVFPPLMVLRVSRAPWDWFFRRAYAAFVDDGDDDDALVDIAVVMFTLLCARMPAALLGLRMGEEAEGEGGEEDVFPSLQPSLSLRLMPTFLFGDDSIVVAVVVELPPPKAKLVAARGLSVGGGGGLLLLFVVVVPLLMRARGVLRLAAVVEEEGSSFAAAAEERLVALEKAMPPSLLGVVLLLPPPPPPPPPPLLLPPRLAYAMFRGVV